MCCPARFLNTLKTAANSSTARLTCSLSRLVKRRDRLTITVTHIHKIITERLQCCSPISPKCHIYKAAIKTIWPSRRWNSFTANVLSEINIPLEFVCLAHLTIMSPDGEINSFTQRSTLHTEKINDRQSRPCRAETHSWGINNTRRTQYVTASALLCSTGQLSAINHNRGRA